MEKLDGKIRFTTIQNLVEPASAAVTFRFLSDFFHLSHFYGGILSHSSLRSFSLLRLADPLRFLPNISVRFRSEL